MTDPGPSNSPDAARVSASDRQSLFRLFFLGAFAWLIYQSLRILSPFATALTAALILVLVFYPAHARLARVFGSPNRAALASTVLALLLAIVPFLVLAWLLLDEAAAVFPHVRELVARPLAEQGAAALPLPDWLRGLWQRVAALLDEWQVDLRAVALESVRQLGNNLTSYGAGLLRNFVLLVFDVIVLVVAIFFFFRDGPQLVRGLVNLVPMEEDDKRMIIDRLDATLSAIVRSAFATASAQGLLAGLGFAVAGLGFPVLLGFATALLAFLPVVGAAAVWAPAGIYLLLNGEQTAGLGLLAWGAVAVSMSDNLIRTVLISGQAQLSLLLLFPGILGGLQVYGVAGALIGPLVIATLLAFARIYHERYTARSAVGRGEGG